MTEQKTPQEGEQFFHCGHIEDVGGKHFFELTPPAVMESPEGMTTECAWLVQCNECFHDYPGDLDRVVGVSMFQESPNLSTEPSILTLT